jgi:hypothetical protein
VIQKLQKHVSIILPEAAIVVVPKIHENIVTVGQTHVDVVAQIALLTCHNCVSSYEVKKVAQP